MVAAIVLFRSQRAANALTGEDESAIRGLLESYGKNDSLGYFATRRDKSVVFAPDGRAAITYRVEVGVCLASGDPIGDPKAWPAAIAAWLDLCQSYGWAPGVMGASSAAAQAFRNAGLNALELGDEAILHPDNFRLSGPDMKPVRQAVTRAQTGRPHGAPAPSPRPVRRRAGAGGRAGRRVARHRDRAWLLHGAWPAGRPGRRRLPARRGGTGGRCWGYCRGRRNAVPGSVGNQWRLARPHAPLPPVAQRHHRIDGQRAVHAVRRHWHQPHFAELRDVPLGLRGRRATGRRPGRPTVACATGLLLPLVAAGDAVPVEHEVPTRMGAPVRLLRGRARDPAGRRGLGHRRGVPGAAVPRSRQAAHGSPFGGTGRSGQDRAAARRRKRAGSDAGYASTAPRAPAPRGYPNRFEFGWPS